MIRYTAEFTKLTKDGLGGIDKKTRKIMAMHRAPHSQTDADRLYTPTHNGRTGMISVEDCVKMETENLKKYVENRNERLLKELEILWKNPGEEMEELHGKATAFTVYEKNRWSEKPENLKLAKDRTAEKRGRRNANGCTRPATKNKQHKEQSWRTKCLTSM